MVTSKVVAPVLREPAGTAISGVTKIRDSLDRAVVSTVTFVSPAGMITWPAEAAATSDVSTLYLAAVTLFKILTDPSVVITILPLKISTVPASGLFCSFKSVAIVVMLPAIPSTLISPISRSPVMETSERVESPKTVKFS